MPSTVLVVGGTSGIGLAAARLLEAGGHDVHVASRNPGRADTGGLTAHTLDANDRAAAEQLAVALAPLDALVLTLGGSEGVGPLAGLDLAGLRRAFDAKLWPTLTVLQACLPHLSATASVTLVGAISARAAMPGTAGIGALNAAVESLVRPLAVELAPRRVNAVSPGLVDTPWWNGLPEQARTDYFAAAAAGLPVRHVSSAEEIAEAVVLLATNASLTGTVIEIDGGARLVQL